VESYELIFIVVPTVEDEALQAQVETVSNRIVQLGGEVIKVDVWGRRQLAYPIKKFAEGQYVLVNMQLPAQSVVTLERDLKISESVLRHLVVRANE